MTDRQIFDVALRPEDAAEASQAEGAEPDAPPTKNQQLAALLSQGKALGVPAEKLRAAWVAKYGPDDPLLATFPEA